MIDGGLDRGLTVLGLVTIPGKPHSTAVAERAGPAPRRR